MIDITTFTAKDIYGQDTLLLGNNARKRASVDAVISSWYELYPDNAIIIFDHNGERYERYEGDALLVDFSSETSVIPDMTEPFIMNESIGGTCGNIAYAIRQAVYQEIRSRDANDKFFDDLGKLSTDRMISYMLVTAKNVLINMALSRGGNDSNDILNVITAVNTLAIFCRQHKFIETLMMNTINGKTDTLPNKYRINERESKGEPFTREFALAKYILEKELRFQKNGDNDAPVPFADLLLTNGENTNTQRCIKMQADASTADFRSFLAMAEDNAPRLRTLLTLKIGEYLKAPSGRPLFVATSGNTAADRGFAPLLIAAVGAAAENTGTKAEIVIPELERWGVLNCLDKFRQNFACLSFIFGYGNFARLALESRTDEDKLIETLYSSSTQRIWHASEEERLTKAFDSYITEADVIYRPEDLDEELRICERDGHIRYLSLHETEMKPKIRSRVRVPHKAGESDLWITQGIKKKEKLTLESLFSEEYTEEGDAL